MLGKLGQHVLRTVSAIISSAAPCSDRDTLTLSLWASWRRAPSPHLTTVLLVLASDLLICIAQQVTACDTLSSGPYMSMHTRHIGGSLTSLTYLSADRQASTPPSSEKSLQISSFAASCLTVASTAAAVVAEEGEASLLSRDNRTRNACNAGGDVSCR